MQGENPPRGGGQQPIVGEQTQNQTVVVGANTPVGAAVGNLDDAARLPEGGRKEQRDVPRNGRRKEINVVTFTGKTRRR